jgi:hypothetical protein
VRRFHQADQFGRRHKCYIPGALAPYDDRFLLVHNLVENAGQILTKARIRLSIAIPYLFTLCRLPVLNAGVSAALNLVPFSTEKFHAFSSITYPPSTAPAAHTHSILRIKEQSMSTEAQVRANQENAQHSTGPKTEHGKATSSRNNFRHGFTGAFHLLPAENQSQFAGLLESLRNEHKPSTITEAVLVETMAQSFWLVQRAIAFQGECLTDPEISAAEQQKQLSLYLRYQTTHQRAFHRSLNDLLKLRAEKRKQEIGFESQKQKEAIIALRQSAENRRQERHKWDVLLAEAKVDHQHVLTSNLEFDQKLAAAAQTQSPAARNAA